MVLVRHPIHAIGHGAIRYAGGRTGAASAAFGNDGELFGSLFARCGDPLRLGLHLDDSNGGHAMDYDTNVVRPAWAIIGIWIPILPSADLAALFRLRGYRFWRPRLTAAR